MLYRVREIIKAADRHVDLAPLRHVADASCSPPQFVEAFTTKCGVCGHGAVALAAAACPSPRLNPRGRVRRCRESLSHACGEKVKQADGGATGSGLIRVITPSFPIFRHGSAAVGEIVPLAFSASTDRAPPRACCWS